ncbi:TPA: LysR substrate-binding domain-containing protein [Bacillus cereus]
MRCLIWCSNTVAVHYLPSIMPALINAFPFVEFSIHMHNSEQIISLLMKYTIDMGLIYKPIDTHPLQKVSICTNELVFAGNIDSFIWLMREKNSGLHFFNELYIAE